VWGDGDDDREIRVGLIALAAIGVVVFVAAIRWVRCHPMPRVWSDLLWAAGIACAASVLLGPLLVGEQPFAEGAGLFFRQIWWYAGITLAAGFLGGLIVMTMGQDWKSQAWKRYADRVGAKPRKVVRR